MLYLGNIIPTCRATTNKALTSTLTPNHHLPFLPSPLLLMSTTLHLLLLRPQNPPPLTKHIRKQRIKPRHIRRQHGPQPPPKLLIHLARLRDSLVDEPGFARDAERVEDEEGVVSVGVYSQLLSIHMYVYIYMCWSNSPQPRPHPRHPSSKHKHKVRIPNHLRNAPRDQHTAIRRTRPRGGREIISYPPHQQQSTRYLHRGGEEGGAYET